MCVVLERSVSDVLEVDDEQYYLATLIAHRRHQHAAQEPRPYHAHTKLTSATDIE